MACSLRWSCVVLAVVGFMPGCGGGNTIVDAGQEDAPSGLDAPRAEDAGELDGGAIDGGAVDAGAADAGDLDGAIADTSLPTDAGEADGGTPRTCGGVVGGVCLPTEYCALDALACGAGGVCTPRPTACPDVVSPVCGCDGTTYDNPCLANQAGIDYASRGPCPTTADCTVDVAFAEGSCAVEFGFAFTGTSCVRVRGCTCTGADCATLEATQAACLAAHDGCPCLPDVAFAEGACDLSFGWGWNGTTCVNISGCTCTGADCGSLAGSEATCLGRHDTCGPLAGTFACGPTLRCTGGLEYCEATSGGPIGAIRYACSPLPRTCRRAPTCATCFPRPGAGTTCTEGGAGELTVNIARP